MERKVLVLLVLSLLAISISQTAFIYYTSLQVVSDAQLTAKATSQTGVISLCANIPPQISFDCATTINQSVLYTCQLNASDLNNNSLSYAVSNISGTLGGSIDSNGLYSVITYQNMTGESTLQFNVTDSSFCTNNNAYVQVNITVLDVNDPPIYHTTIPDLSWDAGNSYRGLFLDDYFSDPDGDDLTYQYFSFSSDFTFIILNSSEIILSHSSCGEGSVIFQAKDPFNLTDSSGVIDLEVPCEEEQSSSGGGGGGGSFSSCKTEWDCGSWGRCFINNTQRKTCVDVNGCADPYERYFYQECTYVAHCYNGIRDIDEEGVDCGGRDCDICETCYDDRLNNEEVEVDCGGPNCNACSNCADGIQNYQETGLDCGGPSCQPCPTCNDGIQNQNETGIDCGGPYCTACNRIETPTLIENNDSYAVSIIVLSSVLFLAILVALYHIYKAQIHAFIASVLIALAIKKRKQILLTDEQKEFLFSRIVSLEKKDLLNKNKLVVYQDLLSRLQRQFFSFLVDAAADTHHIYEQIDKLKTSKPVKSLLKKQFVLLLKLEKQKGLSRLDLSFSLESIRTIIINLSKVSKQEVSRTISELDTYKNPQADVIKQELYNALLAIQFSKDQVAKKKYLHALESYQNLTDESKEVVYDELLMVFHHLAYTSTFRK